MTKSFFDFALLVPTNETHSNSKINGNQIFRPRCASVCVRDSVSYPIPLKHMTKQGAGQLEWFPLYFNTIWIQVDSSLYTGYIRCRNVLVYFSSERNSSHVRVFERKIRNKWKIIGLYYFIWTSLCLFIRTLGDHDIDGVMWHILRVSPHATCMWTHKSVVPTGFVFLVVMSLPVYDICVSYCSSLGPHRGKFIHVPFLRERFPNSVDHAVDLGSYVLYCWHHSVKLCEDCMSPFGWVNYHNQR